MTTDFDAIIIGAGQASFLAQRLNSAGLKVAIVERKLFGGTCVTTGCICTNTIVASAYAAYMARCAADFRVTIDGGVVDMRRVKERKDAISGTRGSGPRSGWNRWKTALSTKAMHGSSLRDSSAWARKESPPIGSSSTTADARPCRRYSDSSTSRTSPIAP